MSVKKELLEFLICPTCAGPLGIQILETQSNEIKTGYITCDKCKRKFQILNFIPRFTFTQNYSESFGIEWEKHANTQLDKFNKTSISKDRLYVLTGWDIASYQGLRVLEIGSGAGRFTQIIHDAQATLHTVDYNRAIDVNFKNNGISASVDYYQASIYSLPFKKASFDRVLCVNVLQHTPDVKKAFFCITPFVKKGGELTVNVYNGKLGAIINWKYILRPVTKRINPVKLYRIINRLAPLLLRISNTFYQNQFLKKIAKRLVPFHNYSGLLPLNPQQVLEWGILDTFDALSPMYDSPQKPGVLERWFKQTGFEILRIRDDGCAITGRKL